jgi:hypothetical protein
MLIFIFLNEFEFICSCVENIMIIMVPNPNHFFIWIIDQMLIDSQFLFLFFGVKNKD